VRHPTTLEATRLVPQFHQPRPRTRRSTTRDSVRPASVSQVGLTSSPTMDAADVLLRVAAAWQLRSTEACWRTSCPPKSRLGLMPRHS
jgi:hypothetical protein